MKAFLILPLVFGALLLIPSFSAAYGGGLISNSATTIWVGTGDTQSWSDPNNWDRQVGIIPATVGFNHALPELCDLVIIDDGSNAVTVHFDISSYQLGNEMQIGSDDTLVIDAGTTFDHTPALCQPINAFAETIVNLGNFNVFGTLLNNGAFINSGAVLDCGIISGTISIPGIVNECPVVGGEIIPLETTSLILAGIQTPAVWMISTFSALGIGAFLLTRNTHNVRNIKVILRDYLDRL